MSVFCKNHNITCNTRTNSARTKLAEDLRLALNHRIYKSGSELRTRPLTDSSWPIIQLGATKGTERQNIRCDRYKSVAADWVELLWAANNKVLIPTTLGLAKDAKGDMQWSRRVESTDDEFLATARVPAQIVITTSPAPEDKSEYLAPFNSVWNTSKNHWRPGS